MQNFWQTIQENILLPKKEQRGDILFWSTVFALLNLTLLFSGGCFFGFKTAKVTTAVIGYTGALFLSELLRAAAVAWLAVKKRLRFPVCMAITVIFCAVDLLLRIPPNALNWFDIAETTALSLLLTAISYKGRFAASFLFLFFTRGITVILPFAPDLPDRLSAMIGTVLSMLFLVVLDCAFEHSEETRRVTTRRMQIAKRIMSAVSGALLTAVILFFAGLFPIHPVSVATGSMQPEIAVGDVLLVQNCSADNVAVGDVIQFRHEGKTVMHRVVAVHHTGRSLQFTTKGDANNANDAGTIGSDSLVGKVIGKIPSLGKLTLWLHGQ